MQAQTGARLDGAPLPVLVEAPESKVVDWVEQDGLLAALLFPLLLDALLAGASTAISGLTELGVGVDFALVNEAAAGWARQHAGQLASQINGTTRRFVQQQVSDWIQSGEPLNVLEDALAPMFGRVRSEMIAITEATGAFAEGNIVAWRESGAVDGKRWMTAEDERVCPICQPLAGMVVELDSNGFTTEGGSIGLTAPPAHTRCRCWLQPVVSV